MKFLIISIMPPFRITLLHYQQENIYTNILLTLKKQKENLLVTILIVEKYTLSNLIYKIPMEIFLLIYNTHQNFPTIVMVHFYFIRDFSFLN